MPVVNQYCRPPNSFFNSIDPKQASARVADRPFHSFSFFPIVMLMAMTPPSADRTNQQRFARFAHLALWRPALRVLCYHRILPTRSSPYTVTTDQLDAQLSYLVRSGFHFIRARDLLSDSPLPTRPLLLTFDDGYVDTLEHALPVLRRHGAKATVFIVTAYTGDRARWDDNGAALMSAQQLRELDPEIIELALHSHSHRAFDAMTIDDIEDDLRKNLEFFRRYALAVTPALAYPYGSRPKRRMAELSSRLASLGIPLAFRLGNRLNRLPITAPYEIQRINVNGEASDAVFRRKLWIGKML
jgi:peptidoglycan/xylan/chitin deacetylase (PgdA/CDA1 family)